MSSFLFVGPPELRAHATQTARFLIRNAADVLVWIQTQRRGEPFVATFIMDLRGALWIADRRTEHIACARGEAVQTAGELEFQINHNSVEVAGVTNQSSGFCPRVESWAALERALDVAGLAHPKGWTRAFEFRRCAKCAEMNIVKDDWFACAACDADLPVEWNIGNETL